MPRFVFPLQTLLRQREREQRERQLVVAEYERQRLQLLEELRQRQQRIDQCRAQVRNLLSPDDSQPGDVKESVQVDPRLLRHSAAMSFTADQQARVLALKLAGVLKRQEQAREQLRLANIRLKVVEQLREKQYQQFLENERKRENDEVDELAVMQAARRIGSEL